MKEEYQLVFEKIDHGESTPLYNCRHIGEIRSHMFIAFLLGAMTDGDCEEILEAISLYENDEPYELEHGPDSLNPNHVIFLVPPNIIIC